MKRMLVKKKRITAAEAGRMIKGTQAKAGKLGRLADNVDSWFHGSKVESLESVRKEGLKHPRLRHGPLFLANPYRARGYAPVDEEKGMQVIHSIKKQEAGSPYYTNPESFVTAYPIAPQKVKTFVKNAKLNIGLVEMDPILSAVEKEMEKEGKTLRSVNYESIAEAQDLVNYYSMILADDAYEKHSAALRKAAEERLRAKGAVGFGEMRKTAAKLGIISDLRDAVIGNVFLDMKLKRSKRGFVK